MLILKRITLSRGGRNLLEDADASIATGERVALVGPNGSGKSTLLAALVGDVPLDAGAIDMPPMRVVRLAQGTPAGAGPAWRFVESADAELAQARAQAIEAERAGDGLGIARAHERLSNAGDSTARSRVKELLAGLGFSEDDSERPVDSLSGGWRMRLNLARVLFVPSDLLLLDEPTNHLDLDAIVWFERWLLRYPGTVIAVSHDRDFLDRVAQATLSIEQGRLVRYAGGYSSFEALRAQRLEQALKRQAEQRARVDHLQSFIDRFRAKATKARQVQSRIKALEKLVAAAPARLERGIDFRLPEVGDSPDPLILAEDLDAGYDGRAILQDVRITIARGARIGVLGRNGAGKSTLVRTLIGELPPVAGECRRSRSVRIGYFAQHGVEELRPDDSPLAFFQRLSPDAREAALRDELGRFGFTGEDAMRPIGPMSGGEKSRLLLASIVRTRPHLLVLDEPTNHLDAATRDALADALADYDGALLLVSHDRYLLRATVDSFVLVHSARAEEFDGDLDDYLAWLQKGGASGASPGTDDGSPEAPAARVDRREERRTAAERRQRLALRVKPLEAELAGIDRDLPRVERRIAEIEQALADPGLYRDARRAADLSRERAALGREREALESRWLALADEVESIRAADAADATAA